MTIEQWHVRQWPANEERVDQEEEKEISRISSRRPQPRPSDDGTRFGDDRRHEPGGMYTGQQLRPRGLLHGGMFKKYGGRLIPNNLSLEVEAGCRRSVSRGFPDPRPPTPKSYLCRIVCAM